MITRTHISQLTPEIGKTTAIVGFVHAIRNQGKIAFLRIRDKFGSVQVVVLGDNKSAFSVLEDLSLESVVKITGLVKGDAPTPEKLEIEAAEIEVLSHAAPELPIPVASEKGSLDVDITNRFDWRWLDLRNPDKAKIFDVWTTFEKGFRDELLNKQGFTQLYAPSLMNTPSESGSEVFEVKYFEKKAYLAQSPQFYKQLAMAAGMERVFMVGPVFRAEPSFTSRHMTQFTGWDFEMSYIDSHHDVMDMEERALVAGFKALQTDLLTDLAVPQAPFPRLTLSEIKSKLTDVGITSDKVGDLSPEEERGIGKLVKEESGSDFVWVTDYPANTRAFYHMRHEDNPELTKGFDLLYKGIEVTTGAQREHRIEVLEKQAKEKGMPLDSLKDYLNFFRFGCPPHGGVGIGPDRIIMKIMDLSSVKEAAFLPRDVKRLTP